MHILIPDTKNNTDINTATDAYTNTNTDTDTDTDTNTTTDIDTYIGSNKIFRSESSSRTRSCEKKTINKNNTTENFGIA